MEEHFTASTSMLSTARQRVAEKAYQSSLMVPEIRYDRAWYGRRWDFKKHRRLEAADVQSVEDESREAMIRDK